MALKNKISFLIDHIDPLGQGVFKEDEKIYFIPKALPGETGEALVLKKKKNIHFCRLLKIDKHSPERIKPLCPHFEQCPGCHFLHVDYAKELDFKERTFERMLLPLGAPRFKVAGARKRAAYRNRIQLHYRKKEKKLGFIQGKEDKILEVPECKIIEPQLKDSFEQVLLSWTGRAKKEAGERGHVEIYRAKSGEVQTSWNKPYAASGFSQVNEEMNQTLLAALEELLRPLSFKSALDLFGGDGNLASTLNSSCLVEHVDIYPKPPGPNFHSLNLMEQESLEKFTSAARDASFDLFIVDPPRSGFKLLADWVEKFSPKYMVYVSCHPQTMVRDLKNQGRPYEILEMKLLDLFPSTFHFEAMALVQFK